MLVVFLTPDSPDFPPYQEFQDISLQMKMTMDLLSPGVQSPDSIPQDIRPPRADKNRGSGQRTRRVSRREDSSPPLACNHCRLKKVKVRNLTAGIDISQVLRCSSAYPKPTDAESATDWEFRAFGQVKINGNGESLNPSSTP